MEKQKNGAERKPAAGKIQVLNGVLGTEQGGQDAAAPAGRLDPSLFTIQISSRPNFPHGTLRNGILRIANPPENRYGMVVTIAREETGEPVFESPLLRPGQYILEAPLTAALAPGEEEAVAAFSARDLETGKERGKVMAEVTLTVGA